MYVEAVPPYIFRKENHRGGETYIVEVIGYKKFKIYGREQFKKILETGDCDPVLLRVLKFASSKGKIFNHQKQVKTFEDAVIMFALQDGQGIDEALEEFEEKGYILSRDKTAGIFPKQTEAPIIKGLKETEVAYIGKDATLTINGKKLTYRNFAKLKKLFKIYKHYINSWETPALIGEFKQGYIAKAPYI
ncbi:MAG: hypothetical protein ACP6IP_03790 [Candidatus Njordarchaeia archaeon]